MNPEKNFYIKITLFVLLIIFYVFLCQSTQYQVFMDEFYEYGSGMKLYSTGHISGSFFNHGITNPVIVEISAYMAGKEGSFAFARLIQLIMGGVSVSLIFYFFLRLFSLPVAFVSSVFFIISPYFNMSAHRLLAENPSLLTFILVLIFFEKFFSSEKNVYLAATGIFFALSVVSKFYIAAYFPFFLILCFIPVSNIKQFKKVFPLILLIIYLFFVALRASSTPLYSFFFALLAIAVVIFLLADKKIFASFRGLFLNKDVWIKPAIFVVSFLICVFIVFPHPVIFFKDFSSQFLSMEVFKNEILSGEREFSPGLGSLPLWGYKYYLSELLKLGLSPLIALLLLPAFLVNLFVFGRQSSEEGDDKKYLLVLMPALYGFLIIGCWKVWFLRYMLHLFPLYCVLSVSLLFAMARICSNFLERNLKTAKLFSYIPHITLAAVFVFFLFTGFTLTYKINGIRSVDNGFLKMAKTLSENSLKGDKIGFTYWQAYSLESNLYHKPYGTYPIMMFPFKEKVTFKKIGESESEYAKVDIIVSTSPLEGNYTLISKTSSLDRVLREVERVIPESMSGEERARAMHFYLREGGGYPQTFWIYRHR